MTVLNVLAPLVSVLLGAGITYWLNVRARRRNQVGNLFADAMAAAAVAEASKDYLRNVSWAGQSPEELSDFQAHLGRAAAENHVRRVAEAREALARVMPYRPELGPFYRTNLSAVYEQTDEIIALLRKGPVISPRRRPPGAARGGISGLLVVS